MIYSVIEVLQMLGSGIIDNVDARKLLKVDEALNEGDK